MTNWQSTFQERGAVWIHDGKPSRPHALLTSGLHSNGFVNCTKITQTPSLLSRILADASGLQPKLPAQNEKVDWVIGSAAGAVTFAYAVAAALNVNAGFTEKDGDDMKLSRFEVAPHERVLVVEDTISTGGSTVKTINGIKKAGVDDARILPYIICLVNRSGLTTLEGREIRSLITPEIHMWKPDECPLCRAGSQAVRPKSHWQELTR